MSTTVIIGGTAGLGRLLAQQHAAAGHDVVIAGRDATRAEAVAAEIGDQVTGIAVDITRPDAIADSLAAVKEVDALIITAAYLLPNTLDGFDLDGAVAASTAKLVGYPEVVRALRDRLTPQASVVLFGGVAMYRPYPGSTMVSAVNSALGGLVRTLAVEIAPHRVNVIHPGLIGDSPRWAGAELSGSLAAVVARSPIGRLVTMAEVADAVGFLLRNGGINAQELVLEGGYLAR